MAVSVPFTNPILAGNTLVRESIQSPDYVPGLSGWAINRDGTAEFVDGTFRGELYTLGADGSFVRIYASPALGARMEMWPPGVTADGSVLLQAFGDPGGLTIATGDKVEIVARTGGISPPYPGGHLEVEKTLTVGDSASVAGMPVLTGQTGVVNVTTNVSGTGQAAVTFPTAFTANPIMSLTLVTGSGSGIKADFFVLVLSPTQFTVRLDLNSATAVTLPIHWIALTP